MAPWRTPVTMVMLRPLYLRNPSFLWVGSTVLRVYCLLHWSRRASKGQGGFPANRATRISDVATAISKVATTVESPQIDQSWASMMYGAPRNNKGWLSVRPSTQPLAQTRWRRPGDEGAVDEGEGGGGGETVAVEREGGGQRQKVSASRRYRTHHASPRKDVRSAGGEPAPQRLPMFFSRRLASLPPPP